MGVDGKEVCIFFVTDVSTGLIESKPQRFMYWPLISQKTSFADLSPKCLFWNAFEDKISGNVTTSLQGKLLTKQWYFARARFSAHYTNKKIDLELNIMSATNPYAVVLLFNSEIHQKQETLFQCPVIFCHPAGHGEPGEEYRQRRHRESRLCSGTVNGRPRERPARVPWRYGRVSLQHRVVGYYPGARC